MIVRTTLSTELAEQPGPYKISGKYGKVKISVTRPRQGYCRYV